MDDSNKPLDDPTATSHQNGGQAGQVAQGDQVNPPAPPGQSNDSGTSDGDDGVGVSNQNPIAGGNTAVQTPPQPISEEPAEASSPQPQPQATPPPQPISAPNKEVAPPLQQVEQHVSPAEHRIELDAELKEAGVESTPDHERPEISEEAQKAGVAHAKESVELDPLTPPVVQLPPYKREEVLPHAQKGPVTDAARWFYTFLLRQIDKVKKQNLPNK